MSRPAAPRPPRISPASPLLAGLVVLLAGLALGLGISCAGTRSEPTPTLTEPAAETASLGELAEPAPDMGWRKVPVTAFDVKLDDARPELRHVGAAHFRAGFALDSPDPDFGGFSGLLIRDDRLLAVSDQGHWWRAVLRHDDDGRLVGLAESEMAPLADLDGRPVSGRMRRDAEELAALDDALLVTFEGDHRSHVYRRAADPAPSAGPRPDAMDVAPENGGMEAVTRLDDGRLLVVAEDVLDEAGHLRAWLADPRMESWSEFSVATEPGFKATAATTLPGGDVLLLQRFWTPTVGTRVRVLRLAADEVRSAASVEERGEGGRSGLVIGRELARFQAPLAVDNFEAVDVRVGPGDRLFAYLLADDNYSADQRTLLFQLELP